MNPVTFDEFYLDIANPGAEIRSKTRRWSGILALRVWPIASHPRGNFPRFVLFTH